jgi:hypothetical protein
MLVSSLISRNHSITRLISFTKKRFKSIRTILYVYGPRIQRIVSLAGLKPAHFPIATSFLVSLPSEAALPSKTSSSYPQKNIFNHIPLPYLLSFPYLFHTDPLG